MKIKKVLITFSSPHLRHAALNFTSSWAQNCARQGTGDNKAVMSIQECLVFQCLCSSVVSFRVFNNPIHMSSTQFSSSAHENNYRQLHLPVNALAQNMFSHGIKRLRFRCQTLKFSHTNVQFPRQLFAVITVKMCTKFAKIPSLTY